jgi:hypothetical protein
MTQVSDVAPRPLVLISIKLQEIVGYLRWLSATKNIIQECFYVIRDLVGEANDDSW